MSNFQNSAMGGKCSALYCDWRNRRIFPKAKFYDISHKRWVCTTCAQSINRKEVQKTMIGNFKQRCISSEDALVLILTEGSI